jgi:hypothetical protein
MFDRTTDAALVEKWTKVLDHEDAPKLRNFNRKVIQARLLENQAEANKSGEATRELLGESTPTNVSGGIAKYDPVLISMVRRAFPLFIANDVVGVQPMKMPTGLVFCMTGQTGSTQGSGTELFMSEPDTGFTGRYSDGTTTPVSSDTAADPFSTYTSGKGMTTAQLEADVTPELNMSVAQISVTARGRALKAGYSEEMADDLMAVHGEDAEAVLTQLMTEELVSEMNRELIRTMYKVSKTGCADTTSAGTFDMNVDAGGRWLVERTKGLMHRVNREANVIFTDSRRRPGNFLIVSADVCTTLAESETLDYDSGLNVSLDDGLESTYAGVLNGKYKVFIDPWMTTINTVLVGYKGPNERDAGLYWCPYTPLKLYRATDPASFQPKIAFKTRYGLVANPFVFTTDGGAHDAETMTAARNFYYRKFKVTNI